MEEKRLMQVIVSNGWYYIALSDGPPSTELWELRALGQSSERDKYFELVGEREFTESTYHWSFWIFTQECDNFIDY